ncbi:MAG: GvpL/GvpF family gas vesicle protein [Ignavibacteriae bacterium]|nr:GvpL/GvpF family gas vesicle protein [Ignavibacteriota bacterium]
MEAPAPFVPPHQPAPAPAPAEPYVPDPPSPLHTPSVRVRIAFDEQTAFVLAAGLISLQDTPSPHAFGVGVDGVERGSEIFAFDHAGMRFFLSTLKNQEASVSRTGMLLLGKQESIRHRNVHESLVNTLRLRSLVLPAEPGTVVFGRNDLLRRVDLRRDALFEILVGLSTLSTWRVHAFVLDAHVQRMLPAETSPSRGGRHDSERARVSAATRKTDIKTLERLLNREKKLAESILQRLAGASDTHTVESMVGLGSGSSEDWKPILKAAFEVPAGRFTRFAQVVVECQEANAMFEPMLTVVGGPGSFSLSM